MSVIFLRAYFFSTALTFLFTSCSQVLPTSDQARAQLAGHTLADADALLKRAKHLSNNKEMTAVYRLRAAEISWNVLDTNGGIVKNVSSLSEPQRQALRILRTATEEITEEFVGSNEQVSRQFTHAGFSYHVNAAPILKRGSYSLTHLEDAKAASKVKHRLCTNWHCEDGVGAPLASKWKRPTDSKWRRFFSTKGYLEPITAVLSFDRLAKLGAARTASIIGYDPTQISTVNLGNTEYPLAADFTAPIVEQTNDIHELRIAITGLIHPGEINAKLISLGRYDPERIPVVFVHGLSSHPRMWKNVINDLRADPKLRGRYQFMLFYYPTAWPISYSAMRLRQELAAWEALIGTPKKLILVGHSMGGILSKMQVINPKRAIWDNQFGNYRDKMYAKLSGDHLSKKMMLFSRNHNIGREVYICTPHRGCSLVDLSITSWLVKILSLPSTITGTLIDIPNNIFTQGRLTSVSGLSPSNPLFNALEKIPIEVPHHSIMGDRGRVNLKQSSDGVVTYYSAHLPSAESEKIVPAGHGTFNHPQAIQELRRILLLHAGLAK